MCETWCANYVRHHKVERLIELDAAIFMEPFSVVKQNNFEFPTSHRALANLSDNMFNSSDFQCVYECEATKNLT